MKDELKAIEQALYYLKTSSQEQMGFTTLAVQKTAAQALREQADSIELRDRRINDAWAAWKRLMDYHTNLHFQSEGKEK